MQPYRLIPCCMFLFYNIGSVCTSLKKREMTWPKVTGGKGRETWRTRRKRVGTPYYARYRSHVPIIEWKLTLLLLWLPSKTKCLCCCCCCCRGLFVELINATWFHAVADSTKCEFTTLFPYDGFRAKSSKDRRFVLARSIQSLNKHATLV